MFDHSTSQMKWCPYCRKCKPIQEFATRGKGKYQSRCKTCKHKTDREKDRSKEAGSKKCLICERIIIPKWFEPPSRMAQRIFCSHRCATVFSMKDRKNQKDVIEKIKTGIIKHYKEAREGMKERECRICHNIFPVSIFLYKRNRRIPGLSRICKKCRAKIQKEWTHKNPRSHKNSVLKTTHGITIKQYEDLATKQGNCCAICKKKVITLQVDHCHKSGKIRGLLCGHCNTGLGFFKDNSKSLASAMEYLRNVK